MARIALLNALHDPYIGLRATAASAFAFWGHRVDVITALTGALSDPDPGVRGNAASSLGNFGTNAQMAVPALLKLLQDTNSYVSSTVSARAAIVLQKIDPEAARKAGVAN